MKETRIPYVAFQPVVGKRLLAGIDILANAIRPTLGPVPRMVAVEPASPPPKLPEMLDNGALIARRFLALPNRDADMGAMLLRHVLWRQHERAGDGTATTAVIFQSVCQQSATYLAAGGNAARLRHDLERGLREVVAELKRQASPVRGAAQIARVAESMCHDPPLAEMLGEIFDFVSEHGQIEVRSGRRQELQREYVLGSYYKGKLLSEWMIADPARRRTDLEDAAVLLTDAAIDDPDDILPLLRLLVREGIGSLLIVTREISDRVSGYLMHARRNAVPCQIIAVKAPDAITGQAAMMDDLAMLTGARLFLKVAGDSLQNIKAQDLGHARRVWGDDEFFGIVGGKGDARALRRHVAQLRGAVAYTDDPDTRKKLRERIGRLLGGTGVLWVGGYSEPYIAERKELAERTISAVRAAMGQGVLPGGGVALLACRTRLRDLLAHATDDDERAAYRILIRALEEPTRTILRNAGYEVAPTMARIEEAGAGWGFDVRSGAVVDMQAAGITDSAGVVIAAVHEAIASAALALTVDVLIHKKKVEVSFEP